MKILIVSDTHGRDGCLEQVVEREAPFDMLIHCGDVEGREFFIEALAECPCYIVSGNNDYYSDLPRETEVLVGGKRAWITHGHYYGISMNHRRVVEEALRRGCDMVFCGHTHRPVIEEYGNLLLVNPGSLTYPRQEGRKPSYAVMTASWDGKIQTELRYL